MMNCLFISLLDSQFIASKKYVAKISLQSLWRFNFSAAGLGIAGSTATYQLEKFQNNAARTVKNSNYG